MAGALPNEPLQADTARRGGFRGPIAGPFFSLTHESIRL